MKDKTAIPLTKQIAVTAILLAICIASQFFKNLSVYITGPIVNLCLILATMTAGLMWGMILALTTPITAFLIAAAPVMNAVPGIIPLIMLGNAVLVVMVHFLFSPQIGGGKPFISIRSVVTAAICCVAKGAVMGLTISLWLLPTFIPEASPLRGKLPVLQSTFSITQLITAIMGFTYFFAIWKPLEKLLRLQGDR